MNSRRVQLHVVCHNRRQKLTLLSLDHPKPRVQAEKETPGLFSSWGCSLRIRTRGERGHLGSLLRSSHALGAFISLSAFNLPNNLHVADEEAEVWEVTRLAHVTEVHRGHQSPIPELRPEALGTNVAKKSHPLSCKIS